MRLDYLLKDIEGLPPLSEAESANVITGISTDPNLCRPGFLYLAAESETVDSTRYGVRLDGRKYIANAAENGASTVITNSGAVIPRGTKKRILLLRHQEPLSILGKICSNFYCERPDQIALVTGTNGKTSTVNFARMMWAAVNWKSCSVGNLGGVCSDGSIVWPRDPTLSVPETVFMHEMLRTLKRRGINHIAMEATSHALFDFRLHGLPATVGAFSNLTRDHLDFHGTMEEYFRVKMLLFTEVLAQGSFAVINADGAWSEKAIEICKQRKHHLITYGQNGGAIKLLSIERNRDGQKLHLNVLGKDYEVQIGLHGYFQASNAICALGIVIATGVAPDKAVALLEKLTPVEGRLNVVAESPSGGKIVVDYAHSPDGIRAALEACRSFTAGKLLVVFGCNGERDSGKRLDMGIIASKLADQVIVTDAHPRSEDPDNIRAQIIEGAPRAYNIANRESAIDVAIRETVKGDTVLIAGLGHEKFRTIGNIRVPYSDTETVERIIREIKDERRR